MGLPSATVGWYNLWQRCREIVVRGGVICSYIEYFIGRKKYDIFEINEVLFAFDQSLPGV